MALCDICNTPGMGTIVKAKDMSAAVSKGFNPFKDGLVPDMMDAMGLGGSSYDSWRAEAISGSLAHSDWNVCDICMTKLKPYLEGSSSACFIATACYGSADSCEVTQFRHCRDHTLMHSPIGRFAVKAYYALSPTFASVLQRMPLTRNFVRRHVLDRLLPLSAQSARAADSAFNTAAERAAGYPFRSSRRRGSRRETVEAR